MANDYTESDRANLSIRRGKLAADIKDPVARAKYIAAQGTAEASGDIASQAKLENDTHNDETTKAIGSFKKGGVVKKTGLYKLHKHEVVVPAKKASHMRDILSGKQPSTKKTTTVDLGKKGSFKLKKGALHAKLGIPAGEKIGQARIKKALNSSDPATRREAASAEGLTHMHKGSKS
jgi:hypothetical protein